MQENISSGMPKILDTVMGFVSVDAAATLNFCAGTAVLAAGIIVALTNRKNPTKTKKNVALACIGLGFVAMVSGWLQWMF